MSGLGERSIESEKHGAEPELHVVRVPALPVAASVSPMTRDFLAWVASQPRTYAEAMEAWRTGCPRFPIWEDALGDDLVRVERSGTTLSEARVVLTRRGQAALDGA